MDQIFLKAQFLNGTTINFRFSDLLVLNSSTIEFEKDVVTIVETNVDDVTGEVLGRTIERLIQEGALDATVTSFTGKKGRVGQTVRVVCERGSGEKFAKILVEETGSLGVKTTDWTRLIVPRMVVPVSVKIRNFTGKLNVKVSRIGDQIHVKPEMEDAKMISEKEKIPLRVVLESITSQAVSQIDHS
jgi:pyridinium-3,5-bisthiocarboxylic acid mononucleotide nickel chelatase